MNRLLIVLALCCLSFAAFAAPINGKGTVTHLSPTLSSVVIVDDSGDPRTYFTTDKMRLQMKSDPAYAQIRAGNGVEFSYNSTDTGRELVTFIVKNPEIVQNYVPFIKRVTRTIEGEIVGKRRAERAITIKRDDGSRRTLHLAEDTVIKKNNRNIKFADLKKGDTISASYSQDNKGAYLFASVAKPAVIKPAPASVATTLPLELPKTAGLYPFIALLSLLAGLGALSIRHLRTRQ